MQNLRKHHAPTAITVFCLFVCLCGVVSKTAAQSWNAESTISTSADVIRLDPLAGNQDPPVITAISVSPMGDRLAAAGDDHAIRIVSLSDGSTLATLEGHTDWVQCIEYSPNGQWIASCGHDGALKVWDVSTNPKLHASKSVDHALLTIAFQDDESLFTAGFGNIIYQTSIRSLDLKTFSICECKDIRSLACSPNHQWLAIGGRDGVLRVKSTSSRTSAAEDEVAMPIHFDRIRSVHFSSDSQQITSVGEDRRVVQYDMPTRTVAVKVEIGGGKLLGLCQLTPQIYAIAGSDNSIRLFDSDEQRVQVKLVGHDGSVSILKKTENKIISGSFDTTIRIWDIDRAVSSISKSGRYLHPVAAQFEDSGAGDVVK
jgi:WD40 repeat protein